MLHKIILNYLKKIDKNKEPKNLFMGQCGKNQEITLSENPKNFKFIFFRIDANATYPVCVVHPRLLGSLRAGQILGLNDGIQVYTVEGSLNENKFTLKNTKIVTIKPSAITINGSTNITEIWGIR